MPTVQAQPHHHRKTPKQWHKRNPSKLIVRHCWGLTPPLSVHSQGWPPPWKPTKFLAYYHPYQPKVLFSFFHEPKEFSLPPFGHAIVHSPKVNPRTTLKASLVIEDQCPSYNMPLMTHIVSKIIATLDFHSQNHSSISELIKTYLFPDIVPEDTDNDQSL